MRYTWCSCITAAAISCLSIIFFSFFIRDNDNVKSNVSVWHKMQPLQVHKINEFDTAVDIENVQRNFNDWHKMPLLQANQTNENSTTAFGPQVWMSVGLHGITIAVNEDGLSGSPSLKDNRNIPPLQFGLPKTEKEKVAWSYRRAFGGCDCSTQCNKHTFHALSDEVPFHGAESCAQLSTHKAWWLQQQQYNVDDIAKKETVKSSIYALEFSSFPWSWCSNEEETENNHNNACIPYISIFGGMEHCSQPLEHLSKQDFLFKNGTIIGYGCSFDKNVEGIKPIATIKIPDSKALFLGSSKNDKDTKDNKRVDQNYSSMGMNNNASSRGGRWTLDGSRWVPNIPLSSIPLPSKNEKGKQQRKTINNVCLIGDSHFERNKNIFVSLGQKILGLSSSNILYQVNFPVSANIYEPARDGISIKNSVDICRNWIKGKAGTSTDSGAAIILSTGSHMPYTSSLEYRELVRNIAQYVKNETEIHQDQQNNHPGLCLVIAPTLDTCHENIPAKWDVKQRPTRNSWRLAAQAEATRLGVMDAKKELHQEHGLSIHFVDLFSPSAALHFGHCNHDDPFHWHQGTFYQEHFRLLFYAVHTLC
mmetsp:Transcript_40677/g.79585  ORF Transcript_40677/g.79585 Transcript_40677/m.79585 type:complete len:590 (+) Transcript_40677:516-2285(+)